MIQPADLSPAEQADVLVCLRESIDRMELEFAQLAAQFASCDHWDRAGYNSPGDWMRFNCHMTAHQGLVQHHRG